MKIACRGGFYKTPQGDADVLVVALHAFAQTPARLAEVGDAVREVFPKSDIYAPRMPVCRFSTADPMEEARKLVSAIGECDDAARRHGRGYREIVLVGHSVGAVMARTVFAIASRHAVAAQRSGDGIPHWTERTSRIVLLAAFSRGWLISSALDPLQRLLWTLGSAWGHFLRHFLRRDLFIFGFRRGAPFMTSARLLWLDVAAQRRMPITVQLVGTDDDYIAPTDNVDLATHNQNFFYLEVAKATHRGIVELRSGDGGDAAKAAFRTALTAERRQLEAASLKKEDVFDLFDESVDDYDATGAPSIDRKTDHVSFIVHGIRDRGFWTRRIARHIKEKARERGLKCRSVTSTYGYFPMGPFLLPWVRRSKVEWLLDQYVVARSLYPKAEFSFVGHSNGTFLLAKAIELCPEVYFSRVIFAGSVVSNGFDWGRFVGHAPADDVPHPASLSGDRRIRAVVNYVATADWVVAIFPNGMNKLRLQRDLGGAGHNGFDYGVDLTGPVAESPKPAGVVDVRFIPGGHSAALAPGNWDDMAEFVLAGELPRAAGAVEAQSRSVSWLGRCSWAIWLLLATVIVGTGYMILAGLGLPVLRGARLLLSDRGTLQDEWSKPGALEALFRFEPWLWAGDAHGWALAICLLLYVYVLRAILTKA
jgi:predicted esterase